MLKRVAPLVMGLVWVTAAGADERPNILLIMADDLGIEGLSCYGGESYQTPHLDRLAASGLRFTHAYSQPLCTPTRVQLLTGRYNHRNWLSFGILDPRERTFGHLLQDAGYHTAIAGKWQLQSYDPPDFPNASKRRGVGMKVGEAGFDEWSLFHSWHTEDKGSRYGNPTFDRNGELIGPIEGGYGPDTSVEFILEFFEKHRGEPTFVYFPMSLPHWPMVPTPDSDVWSDVSRRLEESTEYFPDMVHYMDKIVGQLVDGLDKLGLQEETLVLFYSDNGTDTRITSTFRGEEINGGKASPLQTGIRVPLIASWPGTIQAEGTCDDLIDASDFVPTLAEICKTTVPEAWQTEGVSFVRALQGADTSSTRRSSCFFWYDPRPGWDKERFRRHVFALDDHYKLFADGRFFDIEGEGFRELELPEDSLSPVAMQAKRKLQQVIDTIMQPPLSPAAQIEVDAFGEPIQR